MSKTKQAPELNLLSVETVSVNPVLQPTENSPGILRHETETCSITIHTNTATFLQTPVHQRSQSFTSVSIPFSNPTIHSNYNSTTNLHLNGECNNTAQLRDPLEVLNIITDICLIISAVILVISIGIVFSIVGLAIMRMYFIIGFNEANVTRRFMLNVNELH